MPAETLGKSTPVDKDSPIENIIVLVQENHSFDDYFGHFGKYAKRTDVESAPDSATNPGVAQAPTDAGADAGTGDGGGDGGSTQTLPRLNVHDARFCPAA